MKKVKCIKEVPSKEHLCYSVNVGNIYEVISDSGYDYLIKDDLGKDRYYAYEFFEACGIEIEKIFKGSELQFWSSFHNEWVGLDLANFATKYRLKPDYSAKIAELKQQLKILENE